MCTNALLMSQLNIYSPSSMAHSNIEIGEQNPKMFSVSFQHFFDCLSFIQSLDPAQDLKWNIILLFGKIIMKILKHIVFLRSHCILGSFKV